MMSEEDELMDMDMDMDIGQSTSNSKPHEEQTSSPKATLNKDNHNVPCTKSPRQASQLTKQDTHQNEPRLLSIGRLKIMLPSCLKHSSLPHFHSLAILKCHSKEIKATVNARFQSFSNGIVMLKCTKCDYTKNFKTILKFTTCPPIDDTLANRVVEEYKCPHCLLILVYSYRFWLKLADDHHQTSLNACLIEDELAQRLLSPVTPRLFYSQSSCQQQVLNLLLSYLNAPNGFQLTIQSHKVKSSSSSLFVYKIIDTQFFFNSI
jgi:hypothetical protein